MKLRHTIFALAAVSAAGVALLVPMRSAGRTPGMANPAMTMTDAQMREMSRAYWASHAPRGESSRAVASATYTVGNFIFDADGNLATQVDTVHINTGESVTWTYITGFHTITSGQPGAIDAGSLFNQPMDPSHIAPFTFTFPNAGTFPFFCQFHSLENMLGVVIVQAPASVGPPVPSDALGFVAEPAPNPTRGSVDFRFALRAPGRARLEIFDTRGRRVAVALDRDLEAGVHETAWDGRVAGTRAAPGVYYARLTLPGFASSRRVVLAR